MQKIFSKKFLFLIPIFVFLGLFLFDVHPAKALFGAFIDQAAMDLLQGVFYLLKQLGGLFAGFCGNLFTGVINFGWQDMSVVHDGWIIARDIVNMFFILGLVIIAFATILRIETYGMKALLPKFIIVALLINFSYLICGIIIDASQVVTNYFIDGIKTSDIGLGILDTLGAQNSIIGAGGESVTVTPENMELANVLTMGFDAAILFVAGFVLLVGTILLFLRVGALWVLIILAPFAWFFSIFPGKLQGYYSQWWDELLKWAFFAPIYIFFIYLVLKLSEVTTTNVLAFPGSTPPVMSDVILSPMFQDLNLLFKYVFLVVLLLGAPTVAMSMGIKAAGAVKTFTKGALMKPTKLAMKPIGAGIKGGWRKFSRETAVGRAIKTIPMAWKARREEKEERAYRPAIGKWQDRFSRVFDREKTFNENRELDLLVDKERGDLRKQGLSKEELSNVLFEAKKSGRTDRAKAAMLELVSRADEEGPFEHAELGAKYGNLTSAENWQQLIQDTVKDKKEAMRFAGKVGALAKQSAIPYLDGLTKYDAAKNESVWTTGTEIGERGGYEAMKIQPRQRWQLLNRRNMLNMDKNGKPAEVTNAMKVMLRQLSTVDAPHAVSYMSSVNKRYLVDGERMIRDEINEIAKTDLNQAALAENWFVEIKKTV